MTTGTLRAGRGGTARLASGALTFIESCRETEGDPNPKWSESLLSRRAPGIHTTRPYTVSDSLTRLVTPLTVMRFEGESPTVTLYADESLSYASKSSMCDLTGTSSTSSLISTAGRCDSCGLSWSAAVVWRARARVCVCVCVCVCMCVCVCV